jgi:hypothetical protein
MKKKIIGIFICMSLIAVSIPVMGNLENTNFDYLNNPPVADAGGPYEGKEGTPMTFDASESYDPDGDDLSYRWDFDGDEKWDTEWLESPLVEYTYCDDYYFKVFVEVSDGIDSSIAIAPTHVENLGPTIYVEPPVSCQEGETLNIVYTVEDPGWCDTVAYTISALTPTRPHPVVLPEFRITNFFFDQITQNWEWHVDVGHAKCIVDDMEFMIMNYPWGGDQGFTGMEFPVGPGMPDVNFLVNNPTHIKVNFSKAIPWSYSFCFRTNVKDPQIRWWTTLDGEIVNTGEMGAPDDKINLGTYIYEVEIIDNGTYEFIFDAIDDDNASSNTSCEVTVDNVAPIITPFGPFHGKVGQPITFIAEVTDPGTDDLTFLWDFGDGETKTTTYYNFNDTLDDPNFPWMGTAPFNVTDIVEHTYSQKKTFTVKLTVTDDDGGISEYTTTATVPRNKAIYLPLLQFLQNYPNLFPILRLLLQRLEI